MPRIFDNIEQPLLPELRQILELADRADFCVGYFNLRGWKSLDRFVERWPGGADGCCRLLVGMNKAPLDELRDAFAVPARADQLDNRTALLRKKELAQECRDQLLIGAPTNEDEACLR